MSLHKDDGKCDFCQKIFDRYPGFYPDLRSWFELFQKNNPNAHISCAGRGAMDQESLFHRGATRAHWGHSAHNYNVAIDIFCTSEPGNLYPSWWFNQVLQPALPVWVQWYGLPGSSFFELPHCEVKGWRQLLTNRNISICENVPVES